jgi:pimeloyl-ACP methyl ester carboxylesterase
VASPAAATVGAPAPSEVDGSGAPAVLLLHGMGNTGALWDELRARLPGGERMCAPELPWAGAGAPEWSHHPDPTVWVRRAIEDARRELGGLDVVVAHSFSATVLVNLLAGSAAADHGLRGIVLVAPFYRARPEDFGWELMSTLTEAFPATMEEGIRLVAGSRGNPALRGAMARKVCERLGPYGWTRFVEQYLATPFVVGSRIGLPCLVVRGLLDPTAPPAEAAALAGALPAARLWSLPGHGHFPMLTAPDELAAGIHDFLRRLPTGSPSRTRPRSELAR